MKIVACVKQVPGSQNVSFDSETHRLKRDGIEMVMNPFDTYAVEQAMLVKEAIGGEVIAVSMGPTQAEAALREAISCGADSGILLTDEGFAGSDSWATSYVLAKAIEKIGDVGLVFCGKQAIDGDTAQVGVGIATHLGWAQAAFVSAMPEVADGSVTVRRMFEYGYDECALTLPAVVTVVKDINSPRIPSLRSRMASKKAEIPTWDMGALGLSDEKIGLEGSPTKVIQIDRPAARTAETILLDGTPEENAAGLIAELRKKSLV